mmetsp:Transcript_87434/g.182984  ORF Transcript_87434/g.182984 Transcript_87434/m.182984 type:complete len:219 (-) Transcript_87434:11-667(-)
METSNAVPNPQALATVTQGSSEGNHHFVVVLSKNGKKSLGVDVTYSSAATWTRNGVFVARIQEEGLVADWNAEQKDDSSKIMARDFIFQVNSVHGDTVSMVQEMKMKDSVTLHMLRRTKNVPAPNPEQAGAWVGPNPGAVATDAQKESPDVLLPALRQLGDKELAGLMVVALEKRQAVREQVLGGGPAAATEQSPETAKKADSSEEDAAPPGGSESYQ